MSLIHKIILLAGVALAMSACAHRPLLAPCEIYDGVTPSSGLIAPTADCGPLRPVNGS